MRLIPALKRRASDRCMHAKLLQSDSVGFEDNY